jgi:hypothetical protein
MIDGVMRALGVAGLKSRVLDLKALAVIRAVNRSHALIVNMEAGCYDVMIVVNGLAEIMTTTAWKPDEMSIDERAEHLALALELAVGFYNTHHPEYQFNPDTPLFITGLMSGDYSLVEKLKERVIYKTEEIRPQLECPPNLPVSQYAVNIGLALKGSHSTGSEDEGLYSLPDVNLLPGQYKPWRPTSRQTYATLAIIAVVGLLFPLYQITMEAMDVTAKMEAEFNSLNSLLELRKAELAKRDPLQKAISSYESLVTVTGDVTGDINFITSKADELGIEILSVTHDIDSIAISCQADDYMVFREYKVALEDSGRFTTPVVPPEGYPYIKGGTIKVTPKPAE